MDYYLRKSDNDFFSITMSSRKLSDPAPQRQFFWRMYNSGTEQAFLPRTPVATMPCAHTVDWYTIEIGEPYQVSEVIGPDTVHLTAVPGLVRLHYNDEMVKYIRSQWMAREPEEAKLFDKPTPRLAIATRPTYENDWHIRNAKWHGYAPLLETDINKKYQPIALEQCAFWVAENRKRMRFGENTTAYVKDHASAHPKRGVSWAELEFSGKLPELFEFNKAWMDDWDTYFGSGKEDQSWCLNPKDTSFGRRARRPDGTTFSSIIRFVLKRTRWVGANAGPSTVNAFLTHDDMVHVIRKIFNEWEKIIGCKIVSPKTEGGIIYQYVRDAELAGKKISRYDVKGMEMITPSLLAGSINTRPFGIGAVVRYTGDCPELMSGVGCTSDWDMIAHLVLIASLVVEAPEMIIILGDDATIIGGKLKKSGLYEYQEDDMLLKRTLGLHCGKWMHPVGMNITIDSSTESINYLTGLRMPSGWVMSLPQVIKNRLTDKERWAVAEYFTGSINGTPVSDIIGKLTPMTGVYSPKEWVMETLPAEIAS